MTEQLELTELDLHEIMLRESTSYRLAHMVPHLRVDGVPFDLRSYPYLLEPYDDDESTDVAIMKGAQMGWTTLQVLRTIDRASRIYPRGILYLFPTRDDVTDFSKTRFSRILEDNPGLRDKVQGTESANIKQIGQCFIYFRGAKTRSALKSIPVDCIVFDEFDEMSSDAIALARERLSGSKLAHEFKLSTPTIPEFGIDAEYQFSDQRKWLIRCEACSAWTCLEQAFPECLLEFNDERVIRGCTKCHREIFPLNGQWVAAYPKRKRRGYQISQLSSPTVDPAKILREFQDPRTIVSEFYNSKLGLPYADIDTALDEGTILGCVGPDARRLAHEGPCWAGVDVGKKSLFFVVGTRRSENYLQVHNWAIVESFQDIHDLSERYHVEVGVVDQGAEAREVRKFVESESGWWGCLYDNHRRGGHQWDPKTRTVTVNRTESMDESHRMIVKRQVLFPRRDKLFNEVVMVQLRNVARTTEEDDNTGDRKSKWIYRGVKNDDFRHAFNYGVIASTQTGIESAVRRVRRSRRSRLPRSFMSS